MCWSSLSHKQQPAFCVCRDLHPEGQKHLCWQNGIQLFISRYHLYLSCKDRPLNIYPTEYDYAAIWILKNRFLEISMWVLLCIVMSARSNTDGSDLVYVMLVFFSFFFCPLTPGTALTYMFYSQLYLCLCLALGIVFPRRVASVLSWRWLPSTFERNACCANWKSSKLLPLSVKVTAAGCLPRCDGLLPRVQDVGYPTPSPQDRWDGPQRPETLGAG